MLREYKKAVELKPSMGYAHYALAGGCMGSGNYDIQTIDNAIHEYQRAVTLDPRLTESYYYLAALHSWPVKNDLVQSRKYLLKTQSIRSS